MIIIVTTTITACARHNTQNKAHASCSGAHRRPTRESEAPSFVRFIMKGTHHRNRPRRSGTPRCCSANRNPHHLSTRPCSRERNRRSLERNRATFTRLVAYGIIAFSLLVKILVSFFFPQFKIFKLQRSSDTDLISLPLTLTVLLTLGYLAADVDRSPIGGKFDLTMRIAYNRAGKYHKKTSYSISIYMCLRVILYIATRINNGKGQRTLSIATVI